MLQLKAEATKTAQVVVQGLLESGQFATSDVVKALRSELEAMRHEMLGLKADADRATRLADRPAPRDGRDGLPGTPGEKGAPGQDGAFAQPREYDDARGYDAGTVVTHAGGCYYCIADTRKSEAPPSAKWTTIVAPGEPGSPGVSVEKAWIDDDGALTIEKSNGEIAVVGTVRGEKGEPGVGIKTVAFEDFCLKVETTTGTEVTSPVLRGEPGPQGLPGEKGDPGRSMSYGALWRKDKAYGELTLATWDGCLWVAERGMAKGEEPGKTTGWRLAASRGARGARGYPGATGDKGDKGDKGRGISSIEKADDFLIIKFDDPAAPPVNIPMSNLAWRGEYAGNETYNTGDVVRFGEVLYIAKQPSEGYQPRGGPFDSNWDKFLWNPKATAGGGTVAEDADYIDATELCVYAVSATGSTIPPGKLLYAVGWDSTLRAVQVKYADNTDATTMPACFFSYKDIPTTEREHAMVMGTAFGQVVPLGAFKSPIYVGLAGAMTILRPGDTGAHLWIVLPLGNDVSPAEFECHKDLTGSETVTIDLSLNGGAAVTATHTNSGPADTPTQVATALAADINGGALGASVTATPTGNLIDILTVNPGDTLEISNPTTTATLDLLQRVGCVMNAHATEGVVWMDLSAAGRGEVG